MSTIQKVNWYKNLNNCGHTENLGALFLTKVVTKFHNNTESILLRYLWLILLLWSAHKFDLWFLSKETMKKFEKATKTSWDKEKATYII